MRKRTQLVGFEFGYWKHQQYVAEFLDNALDAIETFQWEELKNSNSKLKFTLDQELSLENLSILQRESEDKTTFKPLDDEAKQTLMKEFGLESSEAEKTEPSESEKIEATVEKEEEPVKSGEITDKAEIEVEEEVKKIIGDMEEIIKPVESIIDDEPIAIIRIAEAEAASFLTSELSQKNVMSYTFEIFDNGTGMSKVDLRKFGKYLASSKSTQLKQTRGSQGFGAPSAFSDSQNTTGKPIVAVSKSVDNVYATVSEFSTTSKNEKKYFITPTEVDCPFLHGTYIKLHYLNVRYIRGYVDNYIRQTAVLNPHITIIYIDPHNEEHIYPRKVSSFPLEPKYALPHPSSTNIGDLQDLLIKTNNLTISSFLKENFVRVSSKTAKEIIDLAERDLQDKLKLLILSTGFATIPAKKSDPFYLIRFEKRVFGRSERPRDKLIIYEIVSEDLKSNYWDLISQYNQLIKNREKINKNIKKFNDQIEKAETKKDEKSIQSEIKKLISEIGENRKKKDKLKQNLEGILKDNQDGLNELKKLKNRTEFEDLVDLVQLSKVKPAELTNDQFNSLFLAFKSIKYMAPPTDTAIPVGDNILENTLIKDLGLRVSENLDDFDTPTEDIGKTIDILLNDKKNVIFQEDSNASEEVLNNISVDVDEIIAINSQILNHVDIKDTSLEPNQLTQSIINFIEKDEVETSEPYSTVFEYFLENYTKDDDFISAEPRDPTSGKGLAYVVEAVLAYSNRLEVPKRSRDVLSRYVNRTPKLRDSADCAITKAVQSVNWKNYKLDTYDNNLPKGPIKLLVNVSGPFVHLMFKSQSKNALADDESLIREIKFCLEAIGRRLRVYINRKTTQRKSEKRASLIEKYIPKFVKSLYNIASQGESIYKSQLDEKELQNLMKEAIGGKKVPIIPQEPLSVKPEVEVLEPPKEKLQVKEVKIEEKEPIIEKELLAKKEPKIKESPSKKESLDIETLTQWNVKELRTYCNKNNIKIPSKIRKTDIIKRIQDHLSGVQKVIAKEKEAQKVDLTKPIPLEPEKIKAAKPRMQATKGKTPSKPKVKPPVAPPKPIQTQLPMITTDSLIGALTDEWQTIKHLIFKLRIKDMMDARFLQIKLKELERKGKVIVDVKMGKKHWKLK